MQATPSLLLAALALVATGGAAVSAQSAGEAPTSDSHMSRAPVLEQEYPALYDHLIRLERAHGIMFGGLAEEGKVVREAGDGLPTFEFEFDMIDRLTQLVNEEGRAEADAEEATSGYAVLGEKGASVIAWGNEFYRDVLGVLVDPTVTDRRASLVEAVERYNSRPDIALPNMAKDMDILYDHPYALQFRGGYADLDGLIWAGHWMQLAVTEPITDFPERERRAAGIDTVRTRYYSKLTYGEPPEFFPSELPLAPAICPGLIFLSPEATMIFDNLSMMQEVLADVLASPDVTDLRAALDEAVDQFLDPTYRMTDRDDWETMALQHGIFFQGGYPLAIMTESELNAVHVHGGGAGPAVIPGMPG